MKKIAVLLFTAAVLISGTAASDIGFFCDGIEQHPEILWGFLPTYISGGMDYTGVSLLEEDTTTLRFRVGAGYIERRFWKVPDGETHDRYDAKPGAEVKEMNPLTYDVISVDWGLRFVQGFFDSPAGDKDFLNVSVGYEGKFEEARDSIVTGERKDTFTGSEEVLSIDSFLGPDYDGDVYPDLRGNHQYLGTNFNLVLELDAMSDTIATNDGYLITLEADWSPYALNSSLSGKADFYQLTANAVGAKTLYQYKTGDMNWFSLVVIDRLRLNWLSGDLVPGYVQKLGSLGRLVRGYSNYTYATQFTAVNNFEFRLTGPSMGVNGISPRVNIFFDMGYGCGDYLNTSIEGDNFLASTGAQFTVSFFDFIDLGYQVAWLLGDGYNFSKGDTSFSGSFTFFLDF